VAWRLAESFQFQFLLLLHFGKRAAKSKIVERVKCQLVGAVAGAGIGPRAGKCTLDSSHGSRRFRGNCLEGARSGNWSSQPAWRWAQMKIPISRNVLQQQ